MLNGEDVSPDGIWNEEYLEPVGRRGEDENKSLVLQTSGTGEVPAKRVLRHYCLQDYLLPILLVMCLAGTVLSVWALKTDNEADPSRLQEHNVQPGPILASYSFKNSDSSANGYNSQRLLAKSRNLCNKTRKLYSGEAGMREPNLRELLYGLDCDSHLVTGVLGQGNGVSTTSGHVLYMVCLMATLLHSTNSLSFSVYNMVLSCLTPYLAVSVEAGLVMDPVIPRTRKAGPFMPCSNTTITVDMTKWMYNGDSPQLAKWNAKICKGDATKMLSKPIFKSLWSCQVPKQKACQAKQIEFKSFISQMCHIDFTPVVADEVGPLVASLSKLTSKWCILSAKVIDGPTSSIKIFIVNTDLAKLKMLLDQIKSGSPIDTKFLSVWTPGIPYTCISKVSSSHRQDASPPRWFTPQLPGKYCPGTNTFFGCRSGQCIDIQLPITVFNRKTNLIDCCHIQHNSVKVQQVAAACREKHDKAYTMSMEKCGSKKLSYYKCPDSPACKLVSELVTAIRLDVKSKNVMNSETTGVLVDCDFATFASKHNDEDDLDTLYRSYSKCDCEYGSLCYLHSGKTIRVGDDHDGINDRLYQQKKITGKMFNLIDLQDVRNKRDLSEVEGPEKKIALTPYGLTTNEDIVRGESVYMTTAYVNNPTYINDHGPDLRYEENGRVTGVVRTESDDIPINTNGGTILINNCLAAMDKPTEQNFETYKQCLSHRYTETVVEQALAIKSMIQLLCASVITQLIYTVLLILTLSSRSSYSPVKSYLNMLMKLAFWDDGEVSDKLDSKSELVRTVRRKNLETSNKNSERLDKKKKWLKQFWLTMSNLRTQDRLVWLAHSFLVYIPASIALIAPLSLAIGLILMVLSFIRLKLGYSKCDGTACYYTACSGFDVLTKPMFLLSVHCGSDAGKKIAPGLNVRTLFATCLVGLGVLCTYWYLDTIIRYAEASHPHTSQPSAVLLWVWFLRDPKYKLLILTSYIINSVEGNSVGHVMNLVGSCDENSCTKVVNIDVDIPISSGARAEFPLFLNGEARGHIKISHEGMTREYTTTYKHSQPTFAKNTVRAVCKSTSPSAHTSCWKHREGPLERSEHCGGCCGGGNYELVPGDENYVKHPMYCRLWEPKGFWWGISDPNDGYEFIGQSFVNEVHSPVVRYYSTGSGKLSGKMGIEIHIDGQDVLVEQVDASELMSTKHYPEMQAQITSTESYKSGKSLGGETLVCLFPNMTAPRFSQCMLGEAKFHNGIDLKVYGEAHTEEQGCLDYTEFTMNRDGTGGTTYGSAITTDIRHEPFFKDMQRDLKSVLSHTSCIMNQIKDVTFDQSCEMKCTNRVHGSRNLCEENGEKWEEVCSSLPTNLMLSMDDCTGIFINVQLTATVEFDAGPGKVNMVDPTLLEFSVVGCWGLADHLQITAQSDEQIEGILLIGDTKGITCPVFNMVREGHLEFNCTVEYTEDAFFNVKNGNKTDLTINLSDYDITKCKSYSFTQLDHTPLVAGAEQDVATYWIAVISSLSSTVVFFLIILTCCFCLRSNNSTTVAVANTQPTPQPQPPTNQDWVDGGTLPIRKRKTK